MFGSIWNLFQQVQIQDVKIEASNASQLSATSVTSLVELRNQLDTLILANQGMWELLSEQLGVSEADLVKKMNEIDLRDGKLDGRMEVTRSSAVECNDCGKKIGRRRTNCYWCGSRVKGLSPFKN
ncbi:hypothetical protein M2F98_19535 [Vibrio vulnificus]|nr:hypothetical protein [Vibrio vulnificus]